jgi:hypothetical protein
MPGIDRHVEKPIGMGKSTAHDAHDAHDDDLQRFSKGVAAPYFEMRDAVMGRGIESTRPTKGDADAKSAPSTLLQIHPLYSYRYSSPSLWGLSSRYFERASIIRWQGIRAGAPPMLLFARNPRAAE